MNIVISQPMYLPWRGIFEQIKLCDVFVFYDDVQLPKGGGKGRGFITRIQIKTSTGWQWISLPVVREKSEVQLICNTTFKDQKWRRSHLSSIYNAYSKTPFYSRVMDELIAPIYKFETNFLSEFCIHSTKEICNYLGLAPCFLKSSELDLVTSDSPSHRVLDICNHLNGTAYISGHGGKNYLQHEIFEQDCIKVKYMDYDNAPYPQVNGPFNPYVSIIDVLFNVGPESLKTLTSKPIDWNAAH